MGNKDEYYIEPDGSHNYNKKKDGSYKRAHSPAERENWFKKGNKCGGRPKGSKNKKTLRQELAEAGGLTPAQFLNSVMNDENANISQRMHAAKELIGFTESKLSSIEVHTDEENKTPFSITLTEGDKPKDEDS